MNAQSSVTSMSTTATAIGRSEQRSTPISRAIRTLNGARLHTTEVPRATALPFGHGSICSKDLVLDNLHTAKRYTMEGRSWLRHCEIYLNGTALRDIATWIRAKSSPEVTECLACHSLEMEKMKETDDPPVIQLPPIGDSGSSTYHGLGINPTV
jgi:hypothetical protein